MSQRIFIQFLIMLPLVILTASGCGSASKHLTNARVLADKAATAQASYSNAVQQNQPQQAQTLFIESSEMYRQAILAYQQAHADVSQNKDLVLEFSQVAEAAQENDLAARAYEHLSVLEPTAWKWKFNAGHFYRLTGGPYQDKSLVLLQVCANDESAPDDIRADSFAELGQIYWSLGLYENADTFFSSAQTLQPDHIMAHIGSASVLIRNGDMVEGSSILDGLGQISDSESALMLSLLAQALAGFQDSRMVFPDTAEQHHAYARLLVRAGKYYETMLALERSVELNPNNYSVYNLLGGVLMQLVETDRARTAYQTSLQLNPNQPRTREILSQIQ